MKKARIKGIVISDSRPSTARKSPTDLQRLIRQGEQATVGSGSAAPVTEDATSSFVTLTLERALEDAPHNNVVPLVSSSQAGASVPVAESAGDDRHLSDLKLETGALSATLSQGYSANDFYKSQTINSATALNVYVPNWSVTNNARIDNPVTCRNLLDHVTSPGYLAMLRNQHDAGFLDSFNINSAQHVAWFSNCKRDAEVAEFKAKLEKSESEAAKMEELRKCVSDLEATVSVKVGEAASLAASYVGLLEKVSALEFHNDGLKSQVVGESKMREEFLSCQDAAKRRFAKRAVELDDRIADVRRDMDNDLYPHMLTAIAGRRWVVRQGFRLAVHKCARSIKCRSALGKVISMAINKGIQEGLEAGVIHGRAGRSLTYIKAYDPGVEGEGNTDINPEFARFQPSLDQVVSAERRGLCSPSSSAPDGASGFVPPNDSYIGEYVFAFVPELVRSPSKCFYHLVRSFPLWTQLSAFFGMTCFVATVDKISWAEACAADFGIVVLFDFGFVYGLMERCLLSFFRQRCLKWPCRSYWRELLLRIPRDWPEYMMHDRSCISLTIYFTCVGPTHHNHGSRNQFMYKTPLTMVYRLALILIARAFFVSAGRVPFVRYSTSCVLQQYPSSSITAKISLSSIDFLFSVSTKTCLVRWAKLMDAILLNASAFLFSLRGTCLIENISKRSINVLAFLGCESFFDTAEYFTFCVALYYQVVYVHFQVQISILSFLDKLPPIVTVCSGYSGKIATLIPYVIVGSLGGGTFYVSATILHSAGIVVLLRIVTIPSSTGDFSIPRGVDGTAWIFLRPGRSMIPLYGDGDLTTMKFIRVLAECSPSPKVTISDIFPNGQDISSLNPRRGNLFLFLFSAEPVIGEDSGGANERGVEHVTPAYGSSWGLRNSDSLPTRPDRDHFLSGTFLRPECAACGLRGPSLVNTVALTELLRWVGLSLSCFSLENALAVREERVPLDAVTELCLLLLGLFVLSHDSDSENWVLFFANFAKLVRGETLRITTGVCLLLFSDVFRTAEFAGVWA
uniref:Transposase (Putative), gypsy type n=1 Tax=Tanacetum cinerariifolium TaxID=118510 RepID=A0A699GWR4_TANCI|nr:hypothetical protein [Tanacetum cinerariifolium]